MTLQGTPMYIHWKKRRQRKERWVPELGRCEVPDAYDAALVRNVRREGKPTKEFIAHLGSYTVGREQDPIQQLLFWRSCGAALDKVDPDPTDREVLEAKIEQRIPTPDWDLFIDPKLWHIATAVDVAAGALAFTRISRHLDSVDFTARYQHLERIAKARDTQRLVDLQRFLAGEYKHPHGRWWLKDLDVYAAVVGAGGVVVSEQLPASQLAAPCNPLSGSAP